jgi:hypothetical protein
VVVHRRLAVVHRRLAAVHRRLPYVTNVPIIHMRLVDVSLISQILFVWNVLEMVSLS